jgi:hypothetical protein
LQTLPFTDHTDLNPTEEAPKFDIDEVNRRRKEKVVAQRKLQKDAENAQAACKVEDK